MTELAVSEREVLSVPRALPKRQATDGRWVKILLLLLCCVTMIAWLAFLVWGSGYLIGIW